MDYTVHVWDTDDHDRILGVTLVRYDFGGVRVESGPHEVRMPAGPASAEVTVEFSGEPGSTAIRVSRDSGDADGHLIAVGVALTRAPEHVGWLPIAAGGPIDPYATTPPLQ